MGNGLNCFYYVGADMSNLEKFFIYVVVALLSVYASSLIVLLYSSEKPDFGRVILGGGLLSSFIFLVTMFGFEVSKENVSLGLWVGLSLWTINGIVLGVGVI